MDIATIVNIVLCVLSFILAVISVVTVVITLRQNHKMIENSTRPYVVIYLATTNFQNPQYYLCIKNFGQSGALITDFNCNYDLKEYSYIYDKIPFINLSNTFIAPNQSFICNIDPQKLFNNPKPLTFSIKYTSNTKKYVDTFVVNLKVYCGLTHSKADTKGNELHIISYTLQDIAEKLL